MELTSVAPTDMVPTNMGVPYSLRAQWVVHRQVAGSYPGAYNCLVYGAPGVYAISPPSAEVGAANVTITLDGENFRNTSVVLIDGVALPTTFVSSKQVTAVVDMSAYTAAGVHTVQVQNGNQRSSNPVTFGVIEPEPAAVFPAHINIQPNPCSVGFNAIALDGQFEDGDIVVGSVSGPIPCMVVDSQTINASTSGCPSQMFWVARGSTITNKVRVSVAISPP